MAEGIARTSGAALLSFRDFVQRTHGAGAFARVLERLPAGHGFDKIIRPDDWFATDSYVHAIELARDLFGPPHFPELYGEAAAVYELTFFHRFVLRFTSPTWIVQRGVKIWDHYHDSGRWDIEPGPRRIRGTLSGFAVVNPTYCRVLVGWLRRGGQLTGAREAAVEHPECRAAGAGACVFQGTW